MLSVLKNLFFFLWFSLGKQEDIFDGIYEDGIIWQPSSLLHINITLIMIFDTFNGRHFDWLKMWHSIKEYILKLQTKNKF